MTTSAPTTAAGTIYVLLPVHNRRAITEQFVRSLVAQTDQGFHLVLIDDGSTDGTKEMVRSLIPSATVISGRGHWWWAGSLEQGRKWLLRQQTGPDDIVLIVNDDTTFGPELLANGRAIINERPRTLLLARPYSAETGEPVAGMGSKINWRRLTFKPAETPEDVDCFPTRGLFFRLSDFIALGSFHTVLLPHYLSDYEFTLRAVRRGYDLRIDPSVRLYMNEETTGIREKDLTSPWAYLRSVLTIRATKNPIYWSTFVLLASPRRFIPTNLLRVWNRFAKGFLEAARPGSASNA